MMRVHTVVAAVACATALLFIGFTNEHNLRGESRPLPVAPEQSRYLDTLIVEDGLAYVRDDPSNATTIDIYDISHPLQPLQIGELTVAPPGIKGWADFEVTNRIFYGVTWGYAWQPYPNGAMLIFDVSDPTQPQQLSVYEPLPDVSFVSSDGRYAHAGSRSTLVGIALLDVSRPQTPIRVAMYDYGRDLDVALTGALGYVLHEGDPRDFISLYSFADPSQPVGMNNGLAAMTLDAETFAATVDYLYVGIVPDSSQPCKLKVFDMREIEHPSLIHELETPGCLEELRVQGDRLVGLANISSPPDPGAGRPDSMILVWDVSEPERPLEVARYSWWGRWLLDIDVEGDCVYGTDVDVELIVFCTTSVGTTTPSPTASPTATATLTPSRTLTPTASPSATLRASPTATATASPTPTTSPTNTPTATPTASPTATPTDSPTPTSTFTPTPSATPTPTLTPTAAPRRLYLPRLVSS